MGTIKNEMNRKIIVSVPFFVHKYHCEYHGFSPYIAKKYYGNNCTFRKKGVSSCAFYNVYR